MVEKEKMWGPIIRTSFLIMILCGLAYPLIVTGVAQAIMPEKADGSLIYNEENEVIGSELMGQSFSNPVYFQSRISSIDYNGAGSGSNNYAPSNKDMLNRTKETIKNWKKANPDTPISEVPMDLITNSGSGLDPHISPEAAFAQVKRISELTELSEDQLNKLIVENIEGKDFGLFGEKRVNVLKLNLELKNLYE
jgi:potassium-transporting ATPase KdpC subunit